MCFETLEIKKDVYITIKYFYFYVLVFTDSCNFTVGENVEVRHLIVLPHNYYINKDSK